MEPKTNFNEEVNVEELGFPEISTEPTGNDVKFESEPKVEFKEPVVEPTIPTEVPVSLTEPAKEKEPEINQDVKVTNPPTRHTEESDIQFNLRKQIYDAGQAKAMTTSDEEKSFLSQHIKELRTNLAKSSVTTPVKVTQETVEATPSQPVDEIAQAKKVLNDMGYISREDLPQYVNELIQGQSRQSEQQEATRDFYGLRKDIASNPAQREALERLVVEKFNISPQSTKQDLLIAMDMAAGYLFPKQNLAPAARQAADKRDLVSFSSNTKSEGTPSGVDDSTRKELISAGWSNDEIDREFAS